MSNVDNNLFITIFADASFCHETRVYGWCFWIKYGDKGKVVIVDGGGFECQSSQVAESIAIDKALEHVKNHINYDDKVIILQSDCLGALNTTENPLNGVRFFKKKHVKGHAGGSTKRSWVNELCDTRARSQLNVMREKVRAEEGIKIMERRGEKPGKRVKVDFIGFTLSASSAKSDRSKRKIQSLATTLSVAGYEFTINKETYQFDVKTRDGNCIIFPTTGSFVIPHKTVFIDGKRGPLKGKGVSEFMRHISPLNPVIEIDTGNVVEDVPSEKPEVVAEDVFKTEEVMQVMETKEILPTKWLNRLISMFKGA